MSWISKILGNKNSEVTKLKTDETPMAVKCTRSHRAYATVFTKLSDGKWWRTNTYTLANNAGFKDFEKLPDKITTDMNCTDSFPGCPYCKTKDIVKCNICGKFSCWNEETDMDCEWCGSRISNIRRMHIEHTIDKIVEFDS